MSSSFKESFFQLPESLRYVLILAAGFMLFLAWDQMYWWQTREDYSFGFLVPLFVAYVIYDRWDRLVAMFRPASPTSGEAGEAEEEPDPERPILLENGPSMPAALDTLLKVAGWAALLAGVVLFGFGAFYRAGAGPSNPASLALALGFGLILLPLLFLHTPRGAVAAPGAELHGGWRAIFTDRRFVVASSFLFIGFIWIISAPLVSVIENKLNLFLLGKVTAVVLFVFEMGGFALERQGNVLVMEKGQVGVAEACSGIRSLTACLFAGSFLGAVFLNRFWKKIALVGAALVLAVITNLMRSLFLTGWAYAYGSDAIEGLVHDVAGYAVLGLTCVGLITLLPLFHLNLSLKLSPEEMEALMGEEADDGEADEADSDRGSRTPNESPEEEIGSRR